MVGNVAEAEIEAAVRDVLIVENEPTQRDGFTTFLTKHGFTVHAAAHREEALALAARFPASVVLMDIVLDGPSDGVEIAREMQRSQPLLSLIFVTAYFDHADYRKQAEDLGLRVGAWLRKPVPPPLLLLTVEKETRKADIRAALADGPSSSSARARLIRRLAAPHLRHYPGIDEELVAEEDRSDPMAPDPAIDALYSRIRDLVARSAREPQVRDAIAPLMRELRTLQERRADELERRYRSRLLFEPEEGRRALDEARRLLQK